MVRKFRFRTCLSLIFLNFAAGFGASLSATLEKKERYVIVFQQQSVGNFSY